MTATFILASLAAVGLFVSVALIPLRMGWARAGVAARASGGWWILTIVTVCLWAFTTSTGLKANAKSTTAEALAQLKVVSAADILKEPDAWLNVPVVVSDVAYCAEPMNDPDTPNALATKVKMRGEDEIEGEENDYIDTVDYGAEEDVVKFTLGAPDSKLRADDEGFTVVIEAPAQTKTVDSGEFSPVANRNLQETEERRIIPCGTPISVSGIITRDGEFVVLDNLPKNLSILTDRPWPAIVKIAENRAGQQTRGFWVWLVLAGAFGLAQLAGALMARGKA